MTPCLDKFDVTQKYTGLKTFNCGHAGIDKFARDNLAKQVKQGVCVAYIILDKANQDCIAGFVTLATHNIEFSRLTALQLGSMPKIIPCIRIVMLGVSQGYKGKQYGSQLMKKALRVAKETSQHVGSFGVYLDADANALQFYQKLGFQMLEGDLSPQPSPMFLKMSTIP